MVITTTDTPEEEPEEPRVFRSINSNEHFEAQTTLRAKLPDPEVFMRNLTHRAVEVLEGSREISQIARWVTDDVFASISKQVAARVLKLNLLPPEVRYRLARRFRLSSVRIGEPRGGIIEGCVVVSAGQQVRVAAIRLEGLDRRWRASSFTLL
jgi:hypothetical protein